MLLKTPNKSIYDPSVANHVNQFRSRLSSLNERDRQLISERLRNSLCPATSGQTYTPNTVGSLVCGCFNTDGSYGGLKPNNTAQCAGSALPGNKPDVMVVHWSRDKYTGNISSSVVGGKGTSCNVFIDDGVYIEPGQRASLLAKHGCQNANFYNTQTNQPIAVGPITQPAPPQAAMVEVTPTSITTTSSATSVVGAFNTSTGSQALLTGAAATTPQTFTAGGMSLWVTFAIILFILIVLIVAFAVWRWNRGRWF